jgi:hypothetical protein
MMKSPNKERERKQLFDSCQGIFKKKNHVENIVAF